jgi:hypothetical protein
VIEFRGGVMFLLLAGDFSSVFRFWPAASRFDVCLA